MIRSACALVASLAIAAGVVPSAAFSPKTRVEIAQRATTLMPASLRRQLTRHESALLREALEPLRDGEGRNAHALNPGGGGAAETLEQAVAEAIRAIDGQAPFSEVSRAFGRVAHFTADLAYPPNTSDDDPREGEYYHAFGEFVESRLDRIPLVWLGWSEPHLAAGDVRGFARSAAENARRDYGTIARSYFPEGRAALPADFDDRSPAFAAASLSFSNAVGHTARVWLYIWEQAHGDRGGTPYLTPGVEPFVPPEPASRSEAP